MSQVLFPYLYGPRGRSLFSLATEQAELLTTVATSAMRVVLESTLAELGLTRSARHTVRVAIAATALFFLSTVLAIAAECMRRSLGPTLVKWLWNRTAINSEYFVEAAVCEP